MERNEIKDWILIISLAVASLVIAYGLMKVLVAVAVQIPMIITGFVFLVLQIAVLVVSIVAILIIGYLIINIVLGFISRFELKFTENIESLRRSINNLSNNLAAEVLAIITSVLIMLAQENLATNDFTKYSITILSAVYLFFSVQLIKSKRRRDKIIGVFFYCFPVIIGFSYYAADWTSFKAILAAMQPQEIVLFSGAVVTLLLAFYYSFMPQSD